MNSQMQTACDGLTRSTDQIAKVLRRARITLVAANAPRHPAAVAGIRIAARTTYLRGGGHAPFELLYCYAPTHEERVRHFRIAYRFPHLQAVKAATMLEF